MQDRAGQPALQPFRQAGRGEVLILQIPRIANRRMTVANVQLIRPGDDSFGDGVAAGKDEIVRRKIELLDRHRHQREIAAIFRPGERQLLDEGSAHRLVLQEPALPLGNQVDHAEEIGLGENIDDLLEHPLGSAVDGQPVVHDRDSCFHAGERSIPCPGDPDRSGGARGGAPVPTGSGTWRDRWRASARRRGST